MAAPPPWLTMGYVNMRASDLISFRGAKWGLMTEAGWERAARLLSSSVIIDAIISHHCYPHVKKKPDLRVCNKRTLPGSVTGHATFYHQQMKSLAQSVCPILNILSDPTFENTRKPIAHDMTFISHEVISSHDSCRA